jgi:hypothetical protein
MGEARSRFAWGHTSALLAMLANVHRDPKRARVLKPADFNPHIQKTPHRNERVGVDILKRVFVDRKGGF